MDGISESLKEAISLGDPRPLYKILLESNVYVYVPKTPLMKVDGDTNEVLGIEIVSITNQDGERATPFFSCIEAMDKLPMSSFATAKVEGWKFFAFMRNSRSIAVLNPNSEYYHKFMIEEVEAIVCGEVFAENGIAEENIDENNIIFLDPTNAPKKFIGLVKQTLIAENAIAEAVLAFIYTKKTDSNGCVLLLKTNGNVRELLKSLSDSIGGLLPRGAPMDIVFDTGNNYSKMIREKGINVKEVKKGVVFEDFPLTIGL